MSKPTYTILHTNDIHGSVEGLARIATLVEMSRAASPNVQVLYFDAGDVEESSQRLSNVTKGAAMHRLLDVAGCDAAVAGNGAWLRYGPQVLAAHSKVARYPILLANLRKLDGTIIAVVQATAILALPNLRLGLIGITTPMGDYQAGFDLAALPPVPLAQELAAILRHEGQLWVRGEPVEAGRTYRVAGSDWEFEPYGAYADPAWNLKPQYDIPTILREALEEYLAIHRPVSASSGRLA